MDPVEIDLVKYGALWQKAQDLGYTAERDVGVSAQEVQAVQPEAAVPAPIDDK